MKTIIIHLFLFLFAFSSITDAQPPYRGRGMGMKKRNEIIEKEKIPFLTKYLDLSVKEAEKFWPLYNEYTNKQQALLDQKRELIKKIKMGNNDEKTASEINSQYIKILQQEYNLTQEYNIKFKKVLPVYKVNKIYLAEREFKRHLIQKMRCYRK